MNPNIESNFRTILHRSRLRPLQVTIWLLLALACGTTFSLPLMAKDSKSDPFKWVSPPSSEWKLRKVKKGEIEVGVKGKPKAINIGLRIQDDVPFTAGNFLDQVRTKLMADPGYQGADITQVDSKSVGGKTWNYFVIKRKDQIFQEFWARSLSSDRILNVLYTTVGNYYELYRNDFMKVLEQAAGD